MKKIILASTNAHKIKEIQTMLAAYDYQVMSLLDMPEIMGIEETGTTFEENACLKAETIMKHRKLPVIADDSGLVIDALNGEPGIYSARYMGHDTSYTLKNKNLLKRMEGQTNRACRFVAAMALAVPDQPTKVFVGTIEGKVADAIYGQEGFGYDPIFYYVPLHKTLAELSNAEKNSVSHRGKALRQLVAYLEVQK